MELNLLKYKPEKISLRTNVGQRVITYPHSQRLWAKQTAAMLKVPFKLAEVNQI